jgi:predicted ATPase
LAGQSSVLLIGKNGSGKTTVASAFEVLQKIARGTNRVRELVAMGDFACGRSEAPMRFEIEVELEFSLYQYSIAFDSAEHLSQLRVLDENLTKDGTVVYKRYMADVDVARPGQQKEAAFQFDRSLVALPILQAQSTNDPIFVFKEWLGRMLILRPIPVLITGDSKAGTLQPKIDVTDFAAWFSGLLAHAPSAYGRIDSYVRQVMPDLKDIQNPAVGRDARSLVVQFATASAKFDIPFEDLSDGEKCFMICALVLVANDVNGPLLCFWDEPDNYLALSEVGHFVMALRKAFQYGGQFIATSHNSEAIRGFSSENTLYLFRRNHLEPTLIRPLSEIEVNGDLVGALIRDDVEP